MNSRGPAFLILFATLMATAGTGISIVAFPWLALQHHDSARDASIVAAAMTLPLVLSTLVAGTAVDFFGRRRVSLVSDSLSGTAVAAVPLTALLFGADAINLAELAVLAFLAAGFDPAGVTARQSMLPEAAARAGWSLDRTNSSLRGDSQPGVHRGSRRRRFDDRRGGRDQHDVGDGGVLRAVLPGDCGDAAGGHGSSRTTRPGPRGWSPACSKACGSSGTCGCCARSG